MQRPLLKITEFITQWYNSQLANEWPW